MGISTSNVAPTALSSDLKVLIFRHSHFFVTHMRKCSYFVTNTFLSLTGGFSKQDTADMCGQTHTQTDKPDLLRNKQTLHHEVMITGPQPTSFGAKTLRDKHRAPTDEKVLIFCHSQGVPTDLQDTA